MKTMENILVTICARGGSKGIPGKNIRTVGGKPLIAWSVQTARKFAEKNGADVILSTDSPEIARIAASYGLKTEYVRPDFLANDTCGKPDAIKDAMLWSERQMNKQYDFVVDLDVTSPIRTMHDVEECVRLLRENSDALTIFSVNPCARNPYFNMVEEKGDGFYGVVLGGKYTTRQSAPKVYDMNASIYVYRRESLLPEHPKAVTPRSLVYVMDHICFDLDEPQDFEYLTYLVETGKIEL